MSKPTTPDEKISTAVFVAFGAMVLWGLGYATGASQVEPALCPAPAVVGNDLPPVEVTESRRGHAVRIPRYSEGEP